MRKPTKKRKGSKGSSERVPAGGRAMERVKQDQLARGIGGARRGGKLVLGKRKSKRSSAAATKKK